MEMQALQSDKKRQSRILFIVKDCIFRILMFSCCSIYLYVPPSSVFSNVEVFEFQLFYGKQMITARQSENKIHCIGLY